MRMVCDGLPGLFRWSRYAQVAQLVEQWTENPRVGGSNPPLGTIYFPLISFDNCLFF